MKRPTPVLVVVLALLVPAGAHAQINLSWNNCLGAGLHSSNKNYACDGSLAGQSLRAVATFLAPPGMTAFQAVQAVVSIDTSDPVLPNWWRLGFGECRDGSLVFPAPLAGVGNTTTCRNPWLGAAWVAGSAEYSSEVLDVSRAQLVMVQHRDAPVPLTANQHYIACAFELKVDHDVEGVPGACAGCFVPACLILHRITLHQGAGGTPGMIALETAATRQYVTWQGGAIGGVGCPPTGDPPGPWPPPYPVDARRSSWGSIKSIYR